LRAGNKKLRKWGGKCLSTFFAKSSAGCGDLLYKSGFPNFLIRKERIPIIIATSIAYHQLRNDELEFLPGDVPEAPGLQFHFDRTAKKTEVDPIQCVV